MLKIIKDVLQALKYLHSERLIVHRDIKPQNILLCRENDQQMVAKLCDFGVSEMLSSPDELLTKSAGTFHFFAPEACDPDITEHNG